MLFFFNKFHCREYCNIYRAHCHIVQQIHNQCCVHSYSVWHNKCCEAQTNTRSLSLRLPNIDGKYDCNYTTSSWLGLVDIEIRFPFDVITPSLSNSARCWCFTFRAYTSTDYNTRTPLPFSSQQYIVNTVRATRRHCDEYTNRHIRVRTVAGAQMNDVLDRRQIRPWMWGEERGPSVPHGHDYFKSSSTTLRKKCCAQKSTAPFAFQIRQQCRHSIDTSNESME